MKIESSENMNDFKDSKYYELVSYLLVGGITTLVYFVVRFTVFSFFESGMVSVVVAQVAAIIFAFITNKLIVFRNKASSLKQLLYQFSTFCMARGLVFILDIVITLITVEIYSDFFIKTLGLDKINYTEDFFSLTFFSNYVGNAVNLNAFIFALLTQVLAIIINYIFSKYFIFKK